MFIPLNLNEVEESKPVPNGRYGLTILDAEETVTKEAKKPQFKIAIAVDGHDKAPNVNHYVGIPGDGDEAKAAQFKALLLKRFLTLFKIPIDPKGFDTAALAMQMRGAKATAELQLDETGDYNRLVVPRIAGEPQGRVAAAPPKR